MGRARGGGGGGGRSSSPSMFGRILCRHLESAKKTYGDANVDQLVDHLRSTYPHYARLKLQPLTKRVHQILHSSGKANGDVSDDPNAHERKEEATTRNKRKDFDQSEEKLLLLEARHVRTRRNNDFSSSSATSSSSSVSSSEEDEVTTSEGDGIDLMKSMLRENYSAKSKNFGGVEGKKELVEFEVVENGLEKTVNLVSHKGAEDGIELGQRKGDNGLGAINNDETNGPKFKDLGGMNDVICQLKMEVIVPLRRPELPRHLGVKPISGILLYGPPGCGKTKLAHAIANEAKVPFYKISATELVSGVSGASEENIRELFSKAHRTAPSIVFIDEIDAIASKRENLQREMDRRTVTQLIICMDESYKLAKPVNGNEFPETADSSSGYVLVIGATNRPDAMDPALRRPGRFDLEIGLGVPDEEARVQILTVLTRNLKIDGSLDLKRIARSTPGYVGADLAALSDKAGNLAMKRIIGQRIDVLSSEYIEDCLSHPWSLEELEKVSITIADFEEAAKIVQPSSRREGFSAVPNVKWDDVGGLHLLRKELDRYIVRRIKYPEDYEDFGVDLETGILLYGPPGCGKTLIAKAVANEAGANFIHIKGPELLNKYVGESESAVRTIFSRARTCSPCILFFDEVDALTTMRGQEGGWVVERLLNQLLIELDGAEQRRGVYVIGATNRPEVMDRALLRPGRFGKLLYVPLPCSEERGMILRALVGKKKIDATVDLMALGKGTSCENFSGADLSALMNEAALAAMDDKLAAPHESSFGNSYRTIKNEHFKRALDKISPSVSEKGDILFLHMSKDPIRAGEIVVFNVDGREIPIVHRVIKVHERQDTGEVDVLTKGDNNLGDDRLLYAHGQLWLQRHHIMGRAVGFLPYVGWVTIIMTEKPIVKKPGSSGEGKDVSGEGSSLEKVPRQMLAEDGGGVATPSLFSSIKHKFQRSEDRINASTHCRFKGDDTSVIQSLTDKYYGPKDVGNRYLDPKDFNKHNEFNANKAISSNGKKFRDDISVPDKLAMRPVVPRLKRVQERIFSCKENADDSASSHNKRQKNLMNSDIATKDHDDDFKLISKFEWLHPSRIKDADGRNPGDPLYDKRTLYIPPYALSRMSASQRQYWDVKRLYMDTVLFFKVGKFYELYELDAEIGHKELDWKMTLSGVGKCRQVGISESGIDDAVQKLISRGYKVGRMEQTETSEQAKSRGTTSVIQRKLVKVLTPATNDENIGPDAVHLLAIKENVSTGFGFAFVDCGALKFWVGSITDDKSCAALGALLMQVSPREIIYERRGLSNEAQRTLEKYSLTGLSASQLTQADAFGEAVEVKNSIESNRYFIGSYYSWESVLDEVAHHDLAICALGGLINHLARLMLNDVIRNGDILSYEVYKGCLRMDSQTLVNLEIFNNNADGSSSGTLYKYLNNCTTSSGKRLLRNWICHPLKDVEKINNRLDVVEDLIANSEVMLLISQSLHKLPDLERLLGCIKSSIQSSALLLLPLIGSKILIKRLGCFVPCEMCSLSVVDIIFTRLGATDRIMTGESTFLIECTETASVLQNASQNSLVVLDELGRGTSTFDGYSIAYAVFRHLVETVCCRMLFATHYHALTKEFSGHPLVTLQHMACSFSSETKKELVFLYRLTSGACPESYGMQVALMGGIPVQVVESANKAAQIMKKKIGKSFELCEKRANFSTLHEEWLKCLVCMSNTKQISSDVDSFDALFCLWHEVKSSFKAVS
ncbi:cell division control protein 48 C isoform 1 [Dorcoceras hygrometricum]|nr:cell division control protein 48 C isoform 1 [Dorcoceras hygrometricum]